MDGERWRRLEALFHEAADLPREERARFLDAHCEDPALRAEADALLEHDSRASGATLDAAVRAAAEPFPVRIGPYRVTGLLGRGGMGAVYLAERADREFEMAVAIKLVRGPATPDVVARFLSERQILARLDHPNIARLLDGGTTQHGEPYVVMERVQGVTIDRFCEGQPPERTLEIFEKVCDAVQYAHTNLVVHRDLKPGNILVDARGEPRLLDFGIAKLLRAEAADVTGTQVRLLTPMYASPEQVAGVPVTTKSDIYALGVILYELLAGRRPYGEGAGAAELEIAIASTEPPRPSAAARDPRRARRLRGDLDTIVLMALRKEPARRYESCAALAEDLRRWRHGEAVRARPATLGYRTRKFVRRNAVPVAASALVFLALALFAVLAALQNRKVEAARVLAERERDAARLERDFAGRMTDLLVDTFELADPEKARGATTTAREVLDRAAGRMREELAERPALRGRLFDVMGRVYQNLGLDGDAEPLLRASLDACREAHGERSVEVAAARRRLAKIHLDRGQLDEAEAHYREALAIRRAELGEGHEDTVESLANLGAVLLRRGRLAEAEAMHEEVLERTIRAKGERSVEAATAMVNLAHLRETQGRLEETLELARRGEAALLASVGQDHPKVAQSIGTAAQALYGMGDHVAAASEAERAIAIGRRVWGEGHTTLGEIHGILASILEDAGRLEEAERNARTALSIQRAAHRGDHPAVARALDGLAGVLESTGRREDAIALYLEAIALWERIGGEQSAHDLGFSLNNLGYTYQAVGRFAEAVAVTERAVELRRRILPADHPNLVASVYNLAAILAEWGRHADAVPHWREAAARRGESLGPGDARTLRARERLAISLEASGSAEEARTILEEVAAGYARLGDAAGGQRACREAEGIPAR